jgi:hypothetical protein
MTTPWPNLQIAAARRIGLPSDHYCRLRSLGWLWCWHCRRMLPATSFYRDHARPNGRHGKCIHCARQIQARRVYLRGEERRRND